MYLKNLYEYISKSILFSDVKLVGLYADRLEFRRPDGVLWEISTCFERMFDCDMSELKGSEKGTFTKADKKAERMQQENNLQINLKDIDEIEEELNRAACNSMRSLCPIDEHDVSELLGYDVQKAVGNAHLSRLTYPYYKKIVWNLDGKCGIDVFVINRSLDNLQVKVSKEQMEANLQMICEIMEACAETSYIKDIIDPRIEAERKITEEKIAKAQKKAENESARRKAAEQAAAERVSEISFQNDFLRRLKKEASVLDDDENVFKTDKKVPRLEASFVQHELDGTGYKAVLAGLGIFIYLFNIWSIVTHGKFYGGSVLQLYSPIWSFTFLIDCIKIIGIRCIYLLNGWSYKSGCIWWHSKEYFKFYGNIREMYLGWFIISIPVSIFSMGFQIFMNVSLSEKFSRDIPDTILLAFFLFASIIRTMVQIDGDAKYHYDMQDAKECYEFSAGSFELKRLPCDDLMTLGLIILPAVLLHILDIVLEIMFYDCFPGLERWYLNLIFVNGYSDMKVIPFLIVIIVNLLFLLSAVLIFHVFLIDWLQSGENESQMILADGSVEVFDIKNFAEKTHTKQLSNFCFVILLVFIVLEGALIILLCIASDHLTFTANCIWGIILILSVAVGAVLIDAFSIYRFDSISYPKYDDELLADKLKNMSEICSDKSEQTYILSKKTNIEMILYYFLAMVAYVGSVVGIIATILIDNNNTSNTLSASVENFYNFIGFNAYSEGIFKSVAQNGFLYSVFGNGDLRFLIMVVMAIPLLILMIEDCFKVGYQHYKFFDYIILMSPFELEDFYELEKDTYHVIEIILHSCFLILVCYFLIGQFFCGGTPLIGENLCLTILIQILWYLVMFLIAFSREEFYARKFRRARFSKRN